MSEYIRSLFFIGIPRMLFLSQVTFHSEVTHNIGHNKRGLERMSRVVKKVE